MSESWGFSIPTDFWPRGRMHERRIQPCQDRPGASLDWGGQEQADWPVPGYSDSSHRFHDSAAISHSTNLPQLVQHRANPLHLPGEGGPDLNMISMSHHNCCILTLYKHFIAHQDHHHCPADTALHGTPAWPTQAYSPSCCSFHLLVTEYSAWKIRQG